MSLALIVLSYNRTQNCATDRTTEGQKDKHTDEIIRPVHLKAATDDEYLLTITVVGKFCMVNSLV